MGNVATRVGHWVWDTSRSLPLASRCIPKRKIPRRIVVLGGGGSGRRADTNGVLPFCSNNISTTKYSWWNFLFLNLWHQLHRPANVYFIIIAILTLTPLSPLSPGPGVLTILVVLGATALREAYEDIKRWRADVRDNRRKYNVYNGSAWRYASSQSINVGDVVVVERDKVFPADLLLLASLDSSGVPSPHCYVETSNLDGERNLKLRSAVRVSDDPLPEEGCDLPESKRRVAEYLRDAMQALQERSGCEVECDEPNPKLYELTGTFRVGGGGSERGCDETNVLLRGSKLKNTGAVAGLVIYTGEETKYMLNTTPPPQKTSNIERLMNRYIFIVLACQLTFIIFSAIMGVYFQFGVAPDHWYIEVEDSSVLWILVSRLVQYLLLYNAFIPISLYVTLEFIRVMQAAFLEWDENMHYAPTDTYCSVRTAGLNEELGQVEYIFSDKTGTLTQNKMIFRMCTVAGERFGNIDYRNQSGDGDAPFDTAEITQAIARSPPDAASLDFAAHPAHCFFALLSLCHSVIAVRDKKRGMSYESTSPDETALVDAAKAVDYVFFDRTNENVCTLRVGGQEVTFRVLNMNEFSSKRGMMSVVVEDGAGELYLLAKGADSKVMRVADRSQGFATETCAHLDQMASAGLRTLAVAYRRLDRAEYETFHALHSAAHVAGNDRKELLAKAADTVEKDLIVLGGTGIEDQLQAGVPNALGMLKMAGIKLWVLTGDKLETAENIAMATRLFTPQMRIITIKSSDAGEVESQIDGYLRELPSEKERKAEAKAERARRRKQRKNEKKGAPAEVEMDDEGAGTLGMIITGDALHHALSDGVRRRFFDLSNQCACVVCCRSSPLQKSQVVDLVHRYRNPISLAIGDGANDISMIQRARIGVGINGEEGMQAVRAADFSIAQFEYLVPLLLVHGRFMYKRIAYVMCFFMYKNAIIATVQLLYSIWSGFSAQTYHDAYFRRGFNLVFTAFPIMLYAIFDQDVTRESALRFPELYHETRRNESFRVWRFCKWLGFGFYDAIVMYFFIAYWMFGEGSPIDGSGRNVGLWESSTVLYTCILLVVNLRVALHTKTWNVFSWIVWIGSLLIWFPFICIYCSYVAVLVREPQMYGVVYPLLASAHYWLPVLLTATVCIFPDVLIRYLKRELWPSAFHIVQEMELKDKKARGFCYFC